MSGENPIFVTTDIASTYYTQISGALPLIGIVHCKC